MNADGSNARRVAAKATSGEPAWSPDGRTIAFRRYDGQPQFAPGHVVRSAGPSDLFVVNVNGSGLRRLTRNAENLRWFAWSPDGRTIAFLRKQRGVHRESRRKRRTETHAARQITGAAWPNCRGKPKLGGPAFGNVP
jgi:TolB protein